MKVIAVIIFSRNCFLSVNIIIIHLKHLALKSDPVIIILLVFLTSVLIVIFPVDHVAGSFQLSACRVPKVVANVLPTYKTESIKSTKMRLIQLVLAICLKVIINFYYPNL